jgi:hypothetical protein
MSVALAATLVDAQCDRFGFDQELAVDRWVIGGARERLAAVGGRVGRRRFELPAEALGGAQHRGVGCVDVVERPDGESVDAGAQGGFFWGVRFGTGLGRLRLGRCEGDGRFLAHGC